MGKFKLKDQLAGIAALIAAIVAIGGGFVKYGEVMTRLDVLSEQTGPDLTPLARSIGDAKKGVSNNQQAITITTEDVLENVGEIKVLQKEIELIKLQIRRDKSKYIESTINKLIYETRSRAKRSDAHEDRNFINNYGIIRNDGLLPDSRETQPTRYASTNAHKRLGSKFRI